MGGKAGDDPVPMVVVAWKRRSPAPAACSNAGPQILCWVPSLAPGSFESDLRIVNLDVTLAKGPTLFLGTPDDF